MSSRGSSETIKLKENIESQLNRLLTQLKDIEEMKDELDEEEYNTSIQETLDQMKEFEISLKSMTDGNLTLVDSLNSVQLAIQDAIRSSFKSPEVIKQFSKKEHSSLRTKLKEISIDFKLGKINSNDYNNQVFEILTALRKLGEELSPEEQTLLDDKYKNKSQSINISEIGTVHS
eukprot:gene20622-26739_t